AGAVARVDVLCLDKTGTLTEGRMKVEDVIPLEEVPVAEIVGNMLHCLKDTNATFMAIKEYFPDRADYTAVHTIPFSSASTFTGGGASLCPRPLGRSGWVQTAAM
ncbi:MAG: HAD family hydrolase, partial [Clostridiales bacterium]|nr:HAD family hydrolase [Clostridiales bacterium]